MKHEEKEKDKVLQKVIMDSMEEGLVVTDKKGKITTVNKAFEDLIGWKEDEVVGRDMLDMLPKIDEKGDLVPREKRSLYKVISGQTKEARVSTIVKTHCYITKARQVLPITGVVMPIVYKDKLIGAVQVFRVVAKEKESEQLKDDFVSLVSHELRTPLTAIDGLVSMMLDGEYGELPIKFIQPLDDIATASERLILLVNDLLSISRIQAGRLSYEISEFHIHEMLEKISIMLRVVAKKKQLAIEFTTDEDLVVAADIDKTKQILSNLIGNAIKYTDEGRVSISYKQEQDMVQIAIEDTGIGIDVEDHELLFGKFQQIGNQKGRPPGTGLGLHISKEIAQQMGGDIWLERSELGVGSIFCFSLPIAGSNAAKKAKETIQKEELASLEQKTR